MAPATLELNRLRVPAKGDVITFARSARTAGFRAGALWSFGASIKAGAASCLISLPCWSHGTESCPAARLVAVGGEKFGESRLDD
jgi:hypothetical protein